MNQFDQMTQQNSALMATLFRVNGSTASAPRVAPPPTRAPAPRPAVGLAKTRTATAPAALRKPAATKTPAALPPKASPSKSAKDDAGDWENF